MCLPSNTFAVLRDRVTGPAITKRISAVLEQVLKHVIREEMPFVRVKVARIHNTELLELRQLRETLRVFDAHLHSLPGFRRKA